MPRHSRSRRLYAWIACFAILLNALAPAVSAAIAAASENPRLWEDMRERGGFAALARVDAPDDDICGQPREHKQEHGPQRHSDAGSDHCPFCLLHAGAFGAVAPASLPLLPAHSAGDTAPANALRPPLVWRQTPLQARAPPPAH